MSQPGSRRPSATKAEEDGELCPDEAIECPSPTGAAARARALVAGRVGAVAFSRTGDPDVGGFADAVVIVTVGDVQADLAATTGV